jgi:thiol-disulfide isomerase/thioredoxin
VVRDAPADIDDFPAAVKGLGISLMGNLLPTNAEEFYGAITKGVTRSEYLGTEKIGDVPCDRCRFFRDNSHWDIWIASGDEPVVHQVVPDMSQEVKNDPSLKGSKLDFKVAFSDWNVAPQFTDSDFAFTPPADSEQVDSLFRKRQAPHELLGKAAPTFQTVDPDGKTIDLSTHLGKNVIMLDFWATWCGPCIMAMPQLEAVGKKFADQGLVFYSVDLGEDTETVKQFLATNELHLSVAMDPDGKIGAAYNVEGIPQTVLIGKDGTVQVVHVGFNDALGEVVTTQIEALLAGKNLAAAAAANDGSETGE